MTLNIQRVTEKNNSIVCKKNTHSRSYIDITNEWLEETHEIRNEIKILQKMKYLSIKEKSIWLITIL